MIVMIMVIQQMVIREFYNLLTAPQTVSNTCAQVANRVQITCSTSGPYHALHVLCHMVRRDSSSFCIHATLKNTLKARNSQLLYTKKQRETRGV